MHFPRNRSKKKANQTLDIKRESERLSNVLGRARQRNVCPLQKGGVSRCMVIVDSRRKALHTESMHARSPRVLHLSRSEPPCSVPDLLVSHQLCVPWPPPDSQSGSFSSWSTSGTLRSTCTNLCSQVLVTSCPKAATVWRQVLKNNPAWYRYTI
jgi:hypothetical protein